MVFLAPLAHRVRVDLMVTMEEPVFLDHLALPDPLDYLDVTAMHSVVHQGLEGQKDQIHT